jgi:hypothetical protein
MGSRVGGFQHAVVRQSRITCSGGAVKRHGLTGRVGWWAHDLATGLPGGRVGRYEVPVCQRFRDPALCPQILSRLAPGGVVTEVGDEPGSWWAASGELRAAFAGLEVLA